MTLIKRRRISSLKEQEPDVQIPPADRKQAGLILMKAGTPGLFVQTGSVDALSPLSTARMSVKKCEGKIDREEMVISRCLLPGGSKRFIHWCRRAFWAEAAQC